MTMDKATNAVIVKTYQDDEKYISVLHSEFQKFNQTYKRTVTLFIF